MYEVLFCKRRKPIIFKMSANASAQNIPIRRIQINHPGDMPSDYGTTPGGTLFSTTPGGTRIIYDRLFLLKCRDSPLSKTPPSNLPDIPGVTTPDKSPPKHVLGKVPEENGKPDGGGFQSSNYFQYPSYPCNLNITNSNYLQVLHHYVPGSRLVQYRQRQAMLSQQTSGVLFHPLSNHCMFQPCMDPTMHGMYSPPPTPLNHSSEMAPIFIHPIRGPATPIFDARSESQLTNWRRSQSIGIAAGMQGYTSERAPPIRSSFPNSSNMPHRNRGCDVSFQLNDNFCLNNDDSHRMSYRYGSCSDSDGSSSPDDPSIIACKPVQKYHFMDENANYAL